MIDFALGDGHGGFGPSQGVARELLPDRLRSADIDGDERRDLIAVDVAEIDVYANVNGTSFAPATHWPTRGGVLLVDFRADGELDITSTVGSSKGGIVDVLQNRAVTDASGFVHGQGNRTAATVRRCCPQPVRRG